MNIQNIFGPLKRLELSLADLYSRYSEHFSEDRAASLVFRRLALDEKSHAVLLDYERRLVRRSPEHFGPVDVDLKEVEAMSDMVDALKSSQVPDVPAAVHAALVFETSASEFHYRTAVVQANRSISRLMGCLGKADGGHISELKALALSRSYVTA